VPLDAVPELPEPEPIVVTAPVAARDSSLAANLAAAIRARRHQLGLSQRQLAGRLKTARTYASKLENLQCTPTLGSLERIANALETSIATLLDGRERSRQQQVEELMKDQFIAELQPFAARLSPLQLRAILAQVHNLTLRRSA
jgi:transcriptional regulator with XRE-family HTH domain